MTRVTIYISSNKFRRYCITANGHATGSEQVCAGISAILYSLAGYLNNHKDKCKTTRIQLDTGSAVVEACGDRHIRAVFEMAAIGLMQIEAKYPEYIQVLRRISEE